MSWLPRAPTIKACFPRLNKMSHASLSQSAIHPWTLLATREQLRRAPVAHDACHSLSAASTWPLGTKASLYTVSSVQNACSTRFQRGRYEYRVL